MSYELKETVGVDGKLYYFAKAEGAFKRITKDYYEELQLSNSFSYKAQISSKPIKVAIIGAGPVGLFFAGSLKSRLKSDVAIDIYEKRNEDKRTHAVNLIPIVLKLLKEFSLNINLFENDNSEGCYTNTPSKSQSSVCKHKKPQTNAHGIIEIKYLQKILLNWNKQLGNSIHYATMTAEKLERFTQEYEFIIASDGKSGVSASQWLHLQRYHTEAVACGLTANFDNLKKTTKRVKSNEKQKDAQFRYRGYQLPTPDHQVYLGIQISEVELDDLESCAAKSFQELTKQLQNTVKEAAKFYGIALPEDTSSIEISLFPLRLSTLNIVQEQKNQSQIILMGDVIVGFNFLADSGVNYGIQLADIAARLIEQSFTTNDAVKNFDRAHYEKFAKSIVEKARQKGKEIVLSRIQFRQFDKNSESTLIELGKYAGYDLSMLSRRNSAVFLSNLQK